MDIRCFILVFVVLAGSPVQAREQCLGFFLKGPVESVEIPVLQKQIEARMDHKTVLDLAGRSSADFSFEKYLQKIRNLKNALQVRGASPVEVQATLYLGAGHDSAFPQLLFENSPLHIGFSLENFVSLAHAQGERLELESHMPRGETWVHIAHLMRKEMAAELVANLQATDPLLRVHEVFAFRVQGSEGVHGLIRFDRGKGTSPQVYLHVNERIDDRFFQGWWSEFVPMTQVALLLKGSQHITTLPLFAEIERRLSQGPGNFLLATDFDGAAPAETNRTGIWRRLFSRVGTVGKAAAGSELGYEAFPEITFAFSRKN